MRDWNSQAVSHFHGRVLPEQAISAGCAVLIEHFKLAVPLPPRLTAIAERHHPVPNLSWNLLTPRHRPPNTLEGQIVFALKWEGLDLGILTALFKVIGPDEITKIARTTPTNSFARRIWFLYEWLTDRELDVPDPGKVRAPCKPRHRSRSTRVSTSPSTTRSVAGSLSNPSGSQEKGRELFDLTMPKRAPR